MTRLDIEKLLANDPRTTRAFMAVITRYVRRFIRNPSRVASVAQAAWLEMMGKLRTGIRPSPDRVRYWVMNCASNSVRRELTRLRHNAIEYKSQLHSIRDTTPEELLFARRKLDRIEALLAQCNDLTRHALEGAARGQSHQEIADQLGISRRAVGTAVFRGRAQITRGLAADDRLDWLRELARSHGRALRLPGESD